MASKTPFVVIGRETNTDTTMTLHRYEGKTHVGVMSFNLAEVSDSAQISGLAENYRKLGDKIYEE
jgi:hypothetical protein